MASNPKYECCTFQGAVVAYDANTGAQIWRASMISAAAGPHDEDLHRHPTLGAGRCERLVGSDHR